jgi:hypothetical protein
MSRRVGEWNQFGHARQNEVWFAGGGGDIVQRVVSGQYQRRTHSGVERRAVMVSAEWHVPDIFELHVNRRIVPTGNQ